MKRFHVHLRVDDLATNINFYSHLFSSPPALIRDDYAKWTLDDPQLNFALSTHGKDRGISHLGIEFSQQAEFEQMVKEKAAVFSNQQVSQLGANCCYAKSNKHWLVDPQNQAWEIFHSFDSMEEYGISDTRESILGGNDNVG